MKNNQRRDKNSPDKIEKKKVFVYRELPSICPICSNAVHNELIELHGTNMKNPTTKKCDECGKMFISANKFYKYKKYLECLNWSEASPLISDIENQKLQKHEKKMQMKEVNDQKKQALIHVMEESISSAGVNFNSKWSTAINAISVKEMNTLIAAFLVKKQYNEMKWYLITSLSRKNHVINDAVSVTGFDTIKGRELIDCYINEREEFRIFEDRYVVKNVTVFDQIYFDELTDKIRVRKEKTEAAKNNTKKVFVYYRLTNSCVTRKHNIQSVTAKTRNIKTGLFENVNVFHCLDCDRYFINYESLQGLFSKGIFPGFNYEIIENSNNLKEMSKLLMYGYSVRQGGLTESERHRILSWIIESEFMTKAEIIRDLQFKVNYNGKKIGNENAKKKWEADILFTSHYTKNNSSRIIPEFKRQ